MDQKQIEAAALIIKDGGLVAFPTETVYGLGANALNPFSVAKIFELKERPTFDPLIVHIASFDDLHILADEPSENVIELAKKFWPGPLTIVLKKSKLVPDIVTSGLPTVGIIALFRSKAVFDSTKNNHNDNFLHGKVANLHNRR